MKNFKKIFNEIKITGLGEHELMRLMGSDEHYNIDYDKITEVRFSTVEHGRNIVQFIGQENFNYEINGSLDDFIKALAGVSE